MNHTTKNDTVESLKIIKRNLRWLRGRAKNNLNLTGNEFNQVINEIEEIEEITKSLKRIISVDFSNSDEA